MNYNGTSYHDYYVTRVGITIFTTVVQYTYISQ